MRIFAKIPQDAGKAKYSPKWLEIAHLPGPLYYFENLTQDDVKARVTEAVETSVSAYFLRYSRDVAIKCFWNTRYWKTPDPTFYRVSQHNGKVVTIEAHLPRFETIKIVGSGTYGTVSLVRDTFDQKYYFKKEAHDDTEWIALEWEAHYIRYIKKKYKGCHPNITCFVQTYFDKYVDERPTILLNCLDTKAENLHTVIRKGRSISAASKLKIALDLLNAIAYTHSLDIAHRDLHLGNIILYNRQSNIYIIDYGIACSDADACDTFNTEREHVPPEVIYSNTKTAEVDLKVAQAADWYACGRILAKIVEAPLTRSVWENDSNAGLTLKFIAEELSRDYMKITTERIDTISNLILVRLNRPPSERSAKRILNESAILSEKEVLKKKKSKRFTVSTDSSASDRTPIDRKDLSYVPSAKDYLRKRGYFYSGTSSSK